jgi:hypothetical protein
LIHIQRENITQTADLAAGSSLVSMWGNPLQGR